MHVCVSTCATAVLTLVQLEAFLDDVVQSKGLQMFSLITQWEGSFSLKRFALCSSRSMFAQSEKHPSPVCLPTVLTQKNSLFLFVTS